MGALILKQGYRHLCTLILEVEEMSTVCFFITFLVTKNFKSSFDLYFHPFIIEFFSLAQLQFKIEEKIHIKAIMLLMYL